ncbi:DUF1351 domain-containing protein [Lachnospiraceae bacterium LCP25S3_G4]
MNELKVLVNQPENVINLSNYDVLKSAIIEKTREYENAVYTDDSVSIAKKTRASLNSERKELDEKRKAVKKEFMKPIDKFEEQMKDLLELYDKPINLIDKQVKAFEAKKKEEKKNEIVALYHELIGEVEEFLPLQKIYDSKWENVSTKMKSIEETMAQAIESTRAAIQTIKGMNSESVETALQKYKLNLSLTDAITYINNYENQKQQILLKQKEEAERTAERQRQAEIDRVRAEERKRVDEEHKIAEEAKAEVIEELKSVDETASAPITEAGSIKAVYTVVATAEELESLETALNSLGIYFERKDV